MIEARNLTKLYGNFVAIEDVSFSISEGEIVGFLGPNGAGKTTTMRILAGYFPPTRGEAYIHGYNVVENPLKAKSFIGYLPENPPLHHELTVKEYLDFAARLRGIPGWRVKARIEAVAEITGITDVLNTLIAHLSKGYRQRVGIAQALIHNPPILILDEPTIGLDPNQIQEIRDLIKSLREGHTIILSTHILPEVEAICNRVIIIDRGKIVADDTVENLAIQMQRGRRFKFKLKGTESDLKAVLKKHDIENYEVKKENGFLSGLIVVSKEEVLPGLIRELSTNFELYEFSKEEMKLEEIFQKLTLGEEA